MKVLFKITLMGLAFAVLVVSCSSSRHSHKKNRRKPCDCPTFGDSKHAPGNHDYLVWAGAHTEQRVDD